MAKIRTIKEAFWTDDLLVQCSFAARLFFIGLWQFADDDGVFEWRPLTLKLKVFPHDLVDVAVLLDELLCRQLIARFDFDGKMFGIVRNFAKHQKVDERFHKSTIGDLTKVDYYYTSPRVETCEHAGSHAGGGGGHGGGVIVSNETIADAPKTPLPSSPPEKPEEKAERTPPKARKPRKLAEHLYGIAVWTLARGFRFDNYEQLRGHLTRSMRESSLLKGHTPEQVMRAFLFACHEAQDRFDVQLETVGKKIAAHKDWKFPPEMQDIFDQTLRDFAESKDVLFTESSPLICSRN